MKTTMKSKKKDSSSKPKPRKFYDQYKKEKSAKITKTIALFFADQAGYYSEELKRLVDSDDFNRLAVFNVDPTVFDESTIREFRCARQVVSLYSKNADLTLDGVDKQRNCLINFIETELKCRNTNQRLFHLYESKQDLFSAKSDLTDVLRKISRILGKAPALSELNFQFGPGQSSACRGENITPRFKLKAVPECSISMHPCRKPSNEMFPSFWDSWIDTMPLYCGYHELWYKQPQVAFGIFGMVPKNAKTLRTTVTEPNLSMPFQKAIGSKIRERLALFGNSLKYQTKNQMLALLGSITGETVTDDLLNASNTLAYIAVWMALKFCPDWFDLLNWGRTGHINMDEKSNSILALESFSSMGNGFTFELESLIFYAIVHTMVEKVGADTSKISVYGDDLIYPVEALQDVRAGLEFFGFTINKEKSFSSGNFRESCGKDYFFGKNVRPFYLKDRWNDARIVGLLNFDYRNYNLLDTRMVIYLMGCLDEANINFGPDGYGDGHIVTDNAAYMTKCRNHIKVKELRDEYLRRHPGTETDPFFLQKLPKRIQRLFSVSDKSGFTFTSIVTTPKRSSDATTQSGGSIELSLDDALIPTYKVQSVESSNPMASYKDIALMQFRSYMCQIGYEEWETESVDASFAYAKFDPMSAFRHIRDTRSDPYVLPGGFRERVINVYTFGNLCALHSDLS